MVRTHTSTRSVRKHKLTFVRKAHRRLQSWERRSGLAQIRTQERFFLMRITRSTRKQRICPINERKRRRRLRYWSFIDGATAYANQRNQLPQADSSTTTQFISHNAIMGNRIMVSKKSIMTRSFAILWLGTFTRLLPPKKLFTADRWTKLTLLVNSMTHNTLTQSDLSVSSPVVNPSFFQYE